MDQYVWYKKYAPKTFEEYKFKDESLKTRFLSFKKDGNIPNLLLSGTPGSGKSSLAYVLINELGIQEADTLVLNGTTIKQETLRDEGEVAKFCSTMPKGSPFKVVLFEEFDRGERGRNALIQDSMRYIIDRFGDDVKFIFTCNYLTKVSEPIQSRCETFTFSTHAFEEVAEMCASILEQEGVDLNDENVDHLFEHVEKHYPDIRKTLVSLQKSASSGTLLPPEDSGDSVTDAIEDWKVSLQKGFNIQELRSLTEHITTENKDEFYRAVYENVGSFPDPIKEKAIVLCAEYLYRSAFVSDQQLLMDSYLLTINQELQEVS